MVRRHESPLGRRAPVGLRRWILRGCGVALLLLSLAVAAAHEHVLRSARPYLYQPETVPRREAILVLGARVDPGGRVSEMLADRLQTTLELFRAGKGERILLSGDGRTADYDEVAAMRAWLVARGVPEEVFLEDRGGLRTLDTVVRARAVFGLRGAVVVSNPFHVPRAVFLARENGLDAVGVAARHGVRYSWRTLLRNRGREIAARLVAWLDVYVLRTQPLSGAPGGGDGAR